MPLSWPGVAHVIQSTCQARCKLQMQSPDSTPRTVGQSRRLCGRRSCGVSMPHRVARGWQLCRWVGGGRVHTLPCIGQALTAPMVDVRRVPSFADVHESVAAGMLSSPHRATCRRRPKIADCQARVAAGGMRGALAPTARMEDTAQAWWRQCTCCNSAQRLASALPWQLLHRTHPSPCWTPPVMSGSLPPPLRRERPLANLSLPRKLPGRTAHLAAGARPGRCIWQAGCTACARVMAALAPKGTARCERERPIRWCTSRLKCSLQTNGGRQATRCVLKYALRHTASAPSNILS